MTPEEFPGRMNPAEWQRVEDSFQRTRRRDLMIAGVAYVILAIAIAVTLYKIDTQTKRNDTARAGLCTLRADYQDRLNRTVKYVEDVKKGERKLIPGTTMGDFQRSIDGLTANVEALEDLHCGK